jgi:hypothetical protein
MRRLWVIAVLAVVAGCRPLVPLGELMTARPGDRDPIVQFSGEISMVSADRLGHSWRSGCPVPIADLRLLSVTYWGFDDRAHQGELVVHADHAAAIESVMRTLYDEQFPIERMELVEVFAGDDDASMAANNTSAFNCREVSRRPGVWSQHAFGAAIDINPVQNPYILRDGTVLPPGAVTDRAAAVPGLIGPNSVVVDAFKEIGWAWGGNWSGVLDYQHFSAPGR